MTGEIIVFVYLSIGILWSLPCVSDVGVDNFYESLTFYLVILIWPVSMAAVLTKYLFIKIKKLVLKKKQ